MATKKPNKKSCKKDCVLAIKYCVAIPDNVLNEVLSLGCANKLKEFGKEFGSSIEKIKKEYKLSRETIGQFKDILNVLDATTGVLKIIEDTWRDKKENVGEGFQKLNFKKEKKGYKDEKKKKAGGILTKTEKVAIKQLRYKGLSIKAIGKTIKRGEKVVANYVHDIEKSKKRK